jgi:hypothetical protein
MSTWPQPGVPPAAPAGGLQERESQYPKPSGHTGLTQANRPPRNSVRFTKHFLREGFGFWAVEAPSVASFIGMVGIAIPSYTAPFTPCVEVGWHAYWTALKGAVPGGKGLGRAGASRLVCMKRPDYFVSVNNRSAFSNLAVQFGIKASDLNDVDNYWATVIAPMMLTPWWVDDRPADHKQADVWDFRAALVDILVKD